MKFEKIYFYKHDIQIITLLATLASLSSTLFFYFHHLILAYGDSQAHLDIAKRVTSSLTPGFAQLGGVWLPLSHIMMMPFVYFDPLWRSGLAGSIVSGFCFIIAGIFLYKLTYLIFPQKPAAFLAFLVFIINPNILYLQSTPMTEIPFLAFFIVSLYFFFRFLRDDTNLISLVLSAMLTFCAALTRYDGWFLVLFETLTLILFYLPKRKLRGEMDGKVILFAVIAFLGIFLWLLWDFLILGDPFYFSSSPFSAKSQQSSFLARGELPGYHNPAVSFLYYFLDSVHNIGLIIAIPAIIGLIIYLYDPAIKNKLLFFLLLSVPFIFNTLSLFLGQTVIYLPELTPKNYEWHLFNGRYGVLMVPMAAFFFGYLFYKFQNINKLLFINLLLIQLLLYAASFSNVITIDDGTTGLSAMQRNNADYWMMNNYNGGLVLIDDYNRSISLVDSNIALKNEIYIGTKPYWEDSLEMPEKYATWIVMERNDAVWKAIYDNPPIRDRMYKYFQKAYTSPDVLIFKRATL